MSIYAEIEIDLQDAFDNIESKKQTEFINENIGCADTECLIEELKSRGYSIVEGKIV